MSEILYIPDCQVKDGVDLTYLADIGKYLVEKRPDIIVQGGDFADMPSLSSYDVGKKQFEGRRYRKDIEVAKEAMSILLNPLKEYNEKAKKNKEKQYKPRMILTLGNHEDRINRAVNGDAKLDGTISVDDLGYQSFGWKVYPFLDVVILEGICFSHYFVSGVLGRPVVSAQALLAKKHVSCVAGHQQGLQVAMSTTGDGRTITGLICGSCYTHDEDYMGPQGNKHFRGVVRMHNCQNGEFIPEFVELEYLKRKYSK